MKLKNLMFAGIKPTGELHLGHYFAVIRPLQQLKDKSLIVFIADYHALTSEELKIGDMANFTEKICMLYKNLLPSAIIFKQSDIGRYVTELAWILGCCTGMNHLTRNHAFKSSNDQKHINIGKLTYPILMAADILCFSPCNVFVGQDQSQHLEYAQQLAKSLNFRNKKTIIESKITYQTCNKIVYGTDGRKMSKSYQNTIKIMESDLDLHRKIMSIKTSSQDVHAVKDFSRCLIFKMAESILDENTLYPLKSMYKTGKRWYDIKMYTYNTSREMLMKIQSEFSEVNTKKVLDEGRLIASEIAEYNVNTIKQKLGF
jgi:tryptophanyl-tRNA synthetase